MGVIRKTLSIGTLGAVSFRSKKEKLRRADQSLHEAHAEIEREHTAREAAEQRVKVEKHKGRKRRRAKLLRDAAPVVERGRKAGRRARKSAAKAAKKTKGVVGPKVEQAVAKVGDAIDELTPG